jgi:hypothetical protein
MPLISALATWLQHFDDELRLCQNHRKNQEVRALFSLLVYILCPYSANCMHMLPLIPWEWGSTLAIVTSSFILNIATNGQAYCTHMCVRWHIVSNYRFCKMRANWNLINKEIFIQIHSSNFERIQNLNKQCDHYRRQTWTIHSFYRYELKMNVENHKA